MKYCLLTILLVCFCTNSFAQRISAADFNTIIEKQAYKYGPTSATYQFIKSKLDFYSVFGSAPDENGGIRNAGTTFRDDSVKEIFSIRIHEEEYKKNIFLCEIEYCAPEPAIHKLEKDFKAQGYRYKKRKGYYIKRKNRKEYNTIKIRKQSIHVSPHDQQPEMVFTVYKKLDKKK